MSIIIGSARIDERGKISGGLVGDQTGKEVSTQNFYMHSKGWYCLRPKNPEHAKKIATAMLNACNNNNIGYDQTNRAAVNMVKKYGSTKAIAEKTETDCSNLVRACILEATGKDVGEFYTGNEADVLEKSGLFETRKKVNSASDVKDGDVLVTMTKGHTAVVISGNPRSSEQKQQTTYGCPYKEPTEILKEGSVGEGVQWMKWHLNKLINKKIITATKLTVTNKNWLTVTSTVFRTFQNKYPETGTNGKPDGECGPKSIELLKKLVR